MEDTYHNIFGYLSIGNIINCTLVCQLFYNIIKVDTIWEELFMNNYSKYLVINNNNNKQMILYKITNKETYYEKYKLCYILNKFLRSINFRYTIENMYNFKTILLCHNDIDMPIELILLHNIQNIYYDKNTDIDTLKYLELIEIFINSNNIPTEL